MLTVSEVTEIFYLSDEFSKEFDITIKKHALQENKGRKHRDKPNRLSDSEVMTILIAFHLSGMRNLKAFYVFYVCKHMRDEF
ncbi:MAG: IS982 family transposase, partial [Mediterranea sp.]|nr:IS982 family transposase [Mediterranea sp.]